MNFLGSTVETRYFEANEQQNVTWEPRNQETAVCKNACFSYRRSTATSAIPETWTAAKGISALESSRKPSSGFIHSTTTKTENNFIISSNSSSGSLRKYNHNGKNKTELKVESKRSSWKTPMQE